MFQISLRQMFILVAAVAAAIVSLLHASTLYQALVGLLAMVVVFAAVIAGVLDRGPRRAFAIGLALAMLGYGVLILNGRKTSSSSGTVTNQELRGTGALPSTILLHELYRGMFAVPVGNVAPGGARPAPAVQEMPFVRTGHYWFALLFGYLGGHFARFVYVRRTNEQAQAKE